MAKLTYRGQSYESTSVSAVSAPVKPIILSYRGVKFEYQPQAVSAPLSCEIPQDGRKPVKLIYRGQNFDIMPPVLQPYRQPRAMNWRFAMIAEYHGTKA